MNHTVHNYKGTPITAPQLQHRSITAPLNYSTAQLQHRSITAPLNYSTAQLQHRSMTAPLNYSTAQLQHRSITAPLNYSTPITAPLNYSTAQLQHRSITAPLNYSTAQLQHRSPARSPSGTAWLPLSWAEALRPLGTPARPGTLSAHHAQTSDYRISPLAHRCRRWCAGKPAHETGYSRSSAATGPS